MTGGYLYRLTTCPRCGHVASLAAREAVCWRCEAQAVERAELVAAGIALAVALVVFAGVLS